MAQSVHLRVVDVGRHSKTREVRAHVFRDCPMWGGFVDLVSPRHHMRWLKPTGDSTHAKWMDWMSNFKRSRNTKWRDGGNSEKASQRGPYERYPSLLRRKNVDILSDLGSYLGNPIRGQATLEEPIGVIVENHRTCMDAGRESLYGPQNPQQGRGLVDGTGIPIPSAHPLKKRTGALREIIRPQFLRHGTFPSESAT